MQYFPITDKDKEEMLKTIGVSSVDRLFSDIPESLMLKENLNIPEGIDETTLLREIKEKAANDVTCESSAFFLGAGIYNHYIPSIVRHLVSRSEFYTSYTPYQPEVSQGILQAFFEYQTMICEITNMDVSNASLYDGATSLVEAILLAKNVTGRKKVLISSAVHPEYIDVIKSYFKFSDLNIEFINYKNGTVDLDELHSKTNKDVAGAVIQHPNFFGCLEDVFEIEKIIHKQEGLFITSVNPVSLSVLEPPGNYNADIVCGEAQCLGNPMSFGGPGLGLFAAKQKYVRNIPGRIVGETKDKDGKRGFVLTLQTREQHIRREKATSNICSNEALLALSAGIYLATLGKENFYKLGKDILSRTEYLKSLLKDKGFEIPFNKPTFNEFVVKTKAGVPELNKNLLKNNIVGGIDLGKYYSELKNHWLLCVTEMNTKTDMDKFMETVSK